MRSVANQKLREQYARAREAQAEYLVDEIIEIAGPRTSDVFAVLAPADDFALGVASFHIIVCAIAGDCVAAAK
jgi:hypothetical protein